MKKLLLIILVLLLPVSGWCGTFAYLQSASSTSDLSAYTFSSQNLGTAASNRYIVAVVASRYSSGTPTLSSVTIGGETATIVVQETSSDTAANVMGIAIALVPNGSTGDVVVTWSASALRCAVSLYRVTGLGNAIKVDSSTTTSGPDPSLSIDVPVGFVISGAACGTGGAASTSWTGVTEDYDAMIETYLLYTTASVELTTADMARSISADISTTGTEVVSVAASWTFAHADTLNGQSLAKISDRTVGETGTSPGSTAYPADSIQCGSYQNTSGYTVLSPPTVNIYFPSATHEVQNKVAIYTDNDGSRDSVDDLIGYSDEFDASSYGAGYEAIPITTWTGTISDDDYFWICIWSDSDNLGSQVGRETTGGVHAWYNSQNYDSLSGNFPSTGSGFSTGVNSMYFNIEFTPFPGISAIGGYQPAECTQRFSDDFSGNLNDWTSSGSGTWAIVSGELQFSGSGGDGGNLVRGQVQDEVQYSKFKISSNTTLSAAWDNVFACNRVDSASSITQRHDPGVIDVGGDGTFETKAWYSDGSEVESQTSGTDFSLGDTFCSMVNGTGNDMEVYIWRNCVNNVPLSSGALCTATGAGCWDDPGDAPDWEFTTNPTSDHNANRYVGVDAYLGGGSTVFRLDDYYAGDCPAPSRVNFVPAGADHTNIEWVGNAATDRAAAHTTTYTYVDVNDSVTSTGNVRKIEVYTTGAITDAEFACFSGTSTVTTSGVSGAISLSSGLNTLNAPTDFTAFTCNAGEYPGVHVPSGSYSVDRVDTGGSGVYYKSGDHIPASSEAGFSNSSRENTITSLRFEVSTDVAISHRNGVALDAISYVTYLGSETFTENTSTVSETLTVPTGTELIVLMAGGFLADSPGWLAGNDFTINSTTFTEAASYSDTHRQNTLIAYTTTFDIGSETLSGTVGGTPGEGMVLTVVYLGNVDTTTPEADAANGGAANTDITGLSYNTGDLMLCVVNEYDDTVTWDSGQTQIDSTLYNSDRVATAYEFSTGDCNYTPGTGTYSDVTAVVIDAK